MRVIHKTKLTESDANPLDSAIAETTSKDLVKEALLKAVASESGAICEYDQLLTLITKAGNSLQGKNKIQKTIEDLKREEEKHLAQLNEALKLFDDIAEGLEAGEEEAKSGEDKEEVKESVLTESIVEKVPDNSRGFDSDTILDIILNNFDPTNESETAIYRLFSEPADLTASEVDAKLEQVKQILNISPEHMEALEQMIMASKDPIVERVKEFQDDIQSDADYIKMMAENVTTIAAHKGLTALVNNLAEIHYDGARDTVWEMSKLNNLESTANINILS